MSFIPRSSCSISLVARSLSFYSCATSPRLNLPRSHLPFHHSSPVRFTSSSPSSSLSSSSSGKLEMSDTNQGGDSSKKTYHKKATGEALTTVKNHAKQEDLKLYGSCFWYVPPRPILTLKCTYISKPFRPTSLDLPRAQIHPLPIHRSRPVQKASIAARRQPARPGPRNPPRPNMEHPRIHRHNGVPRRPIPH